MVRVRHMRRRILLLGAAGGLASGVPAAGCADDPGYPAGPLRIASGGMGGVYHAYAQGIANVVRTALPRLRPTVLATPASARGSGTGVRTALPSLPPPVLAPPASVENLQMVAAGRAEIGFTSADAAADAFLGRPPFPAPLGVTALGRIYENYLHLVVR